MQTFIIAATSVDGFIAKNINQSPLDWTSGADKKFFVKKTKQAGVMVMGRATFETINRPLPGRLTVVMTKNKQFISKNNWPNFDQVKESKGQVIFTDLKPLAIQNKLQKLGYLQTAICGGSSIYTLWMRQNLVNKLFLTVEPIIFGDGVKLFNSNINQKLQLVSSQKLNDLGTHLVEWQIRV